MIGLLFLEICICLSLVISATFLLSPNLVLFHDDLYPLITHHSLWPVNQESTPGARDHPSLKPPQASTARIHEGHYQMHLQSKKISYVYAKYTIEGLHPLDHGLSRGVRSVLRSRHQLWCGLRKHTHVLIREEWCWEFLIAIIAKTNTVPSSYVYFVLFLVISVDYLQKDLCHFSHKSYVVLPDLITKNYY